MGFARERLSVVFLRMLKLEAVPGKRVLWFLACGLVLTGTSWGQWETQDISLEPGWNAIQLKVQPSDSACDVVFTNTAVETVHWWRREGASEEFDVDPDTLYPHSGSWEYWFASNATVSTFGSLSAGETYQIRVATNAPTQHVSLKGWVVLNPIYWVPDELNLVGLPVLAGGNCTFGQFFSFSGDFEVNSMTATVFSVAADGSPDRVLQPWTTTIRSGEAYWVKAGQDASSYSGPLHVTTDTGARVLDFGESIVPRYLNIENRTAISRVVRIAMEASEAPPADEEPLLGVPALLYIVGEGSGQSYQQFPSVLTTNIAGNSTLTLKVAPDVESLTNGVAGSSWQGVLDISDGDNIEFSDVTLCKRIGVSCAGEISGQTIPAGLWVGDVTVSHVSRAPARSGTESSWDSTEVQPVREPFVFRVLFHVDEAGETRLLQRVMVAWRPDGDVVETPIGSYTNGILELLSDESLAEAYAIEHDDAVIQRISSTSFPLMDPVLLSGMFGGANSLSGVVALPFDDPVNPFLHCFHPQHDNLEYRNSEPFALEDGDESFSVTRALWFTFSEEDPDLGIANRQWGITEAGGSFRETIEGLNKTIYAQGAFRVTKVSDIGLLQ